MPAPPDLDVARIRRFCESRVPAQLRDEARVEATVRGNNVTIHDCRPPWTDDLEEWSRTPVAELRYSPESTRWTLYWANSSGRWHRYDFLDSGSVDELLQEIENDQTAIFWG